MTDPKPDMDSCKVIDTVKSNQLVTPTNESQTRPIVSVCEREGNRMNLSEIEKPMPGDLCLICGRPAIMAGVFIPENPRAWGAPTGRSRLFRYGLCDECKGHQDTPDKVEKILRSYLNSGEVEY